MWLAYSNEGKKKKKHKENEEEQQGETIENERL